MRSGAGLDSGKEKRLFFLFGVSHFLNFLFLLFLLVLLFFFFEEHRLKEFGGKLGVVAIILNF